MIAAIKDTSGATANDVMKLRTEPKNSTMLFTPLTNQVAAVVIPSQTFSKACCTLEKIEDAKERRLNNAR